MCGRFLLFTDPDTLDVKFHFFLATELEKRYNIAPSQEVPVLRISPYSGLRELAALKWGLVPPWAKDKSIGTRLINARAETLAEKASFRSAYRYRRCAILADGFYEWKQEGRGKVPYLISREDDEPFAMAGLWELWESERGEIIESATIITCDANSLLAGLHNRMPVILTEDGLEQWLEIENNRTSTLQHLLVPCESDLLKLREVNRVVNSPSVDSPECIQSPQRNLFD